MSLKGDKLESSEDEERRETLTSTFASSTVNGETESEGPIQFSNIRSNDSLDFSRATEYRIRGLARTLSHMSRTSAAQVPGHVNPFTTMEIPALDPNSPFFDAELWAKTYFNIMEDDPERYPQRTAGVSYRNLNVFGFGSDTDYQKTVFNIFLSSLEAIQEIFRGQPRVPILTDFDGLIKSGEMCVVLGRPGSGVSTLLKTIAGKTRGLSVDKSSQLNYQGITPEMMHNKFRGEVVYQAEVDEHFPHLSVGQTLMFTARCRTPVNRLPGVSRDQFAQHLRDVIMAVVGLSHTVDTRVGNDYIRGVSGGERKRVSIAEVLMNMSVIQCWDNSTRGLDSATALQFVKTLRMACNLAGTTTIVAIYQASEDAIMNFDKLSLLYEGRQIYFGTPVAAKKYFTEMGYLCPPRQITADFLTSLTNPSERVVRPGYEDQVPRTPDEFATRWALSETRRQLLADIEAYEQEYPLSGPQVEEFKASKRAQQAGSRISPYTLSVPMQIRACLIRAFQRLLGQSAFTLITMFANILIGLVLGSIFYRLNETTSSFYGRGLTLFVAILFNALTSALEILPLYVQRPVMEKHVSFALHHAFSEGFASIFSELPSKAICAILFNLPIYFMTNLRREAGPFFIFMLFAFTCTLTMSFIFRFIGQTTRTLSQAMLPGSLFLLALIVYTGFILPISSMQGWMRWINYINPTAYAFEAIMANEFHNRKFPCAQFIPSGPSYMNATGLERTCSTAGSLALGLDYIDGDAYIEATYGYYHSHLWRNFGILIAFLVFFLFAYLAATEFVCFDSSKGEVLVFKRGNKKYVPEKRKLDEESHGSEKEKPSPLRTGDEQPTELMPKLRRQTAIFHWEDVRWKIDIKGKSRYILDGVSGWVKPGTLTALMGASGAGKTSLLNVLANRADVGIIQGDILINGRERLNNFQRQTGYVQQGDIHLSTSTVREALVFSAFLRQPFEVSKQEKLDYVDEIIHLLEMEKYADAVVGEPGLGLNVEQRKRLTIGVELVAKPNLLFFLDEPTSGLDSQTAWSIMDLIRKLANNGQAILCTIHQPSAILFEQFDRLLLLGKGGKTMYFGELGNDCQTMTSYFERNGAQSCDPTRNPAEWMLECIGAAPGINTDIDWAQTWKDSSEGAAVTKHLAELKQSLLAEPYEVDHSAAAKPFAAPFYFQMGMTFRRCAQQYWRDPSYIYSKLFLAFMNSLFLGLSFMDAKLSLQGLQNQMFSFFMLLTNLAFLAYQAMPAFIANRDIYEARERPSKIYAWPAFLLSAMIIEIPWNSLCAVIQFLCMFYPIGFRKNMIPTHSTTSRSGLMFLLYWIFMLYTSTFTNLVVAAAANAEIGAICAVILFVMSLIFCGVLVGPSALPGFWIFMYRVSPLNYLVSAFLSTGLANTEVKCSSLELLSLQPPSGQTCSQYLNGYIEIMGGTLHNPDATSSCAYCTVAGTSTFLASVSSFFDERWRNYGLLWVYVVFNAVGALFLYWLLRIPRKWNLVGKVMAIKEKLLRK